MRRLLVKSCEIIKYFGDWYVNEQDYIQNRVKRELIVYYENLQNFFLIFFVDLIVLNLLEGIL